MSRKKNQSKGLYCRGCRKTWDEKRFDSSAKRYLLLEKVCPECGGLLSRPEEDNETGKAEDDLALWGISGSTLRY